MSTQLSLILLYLCAGGLVLLCVTHLSKKAADDGVREAGDALAGMQAHPWIGFLMVLAWPATLALVVSGGVDFIKSEIQRRKNAPKVTRAFNGCVNGPDRRFRRAR